MAVATMFSGKRAIHTTEDLAAVYRSPEFDTARAWPLAHPGSKAEELEKKLNELNLVPATFVGRARFFDERVTLWENLIAQYLVPRAPDLRQAIIDALRWVGYCSGWLTRIRC